MGGPYRVAAPFLHILIQISVDRSPFSLKFVITCLQSCRKKFGDISNFQEVLKLSNATKLLLHTQSKSSIGAPYYIHTCTHILVAPYSENNTKMAVQLMLFILKYVWTINKPTKQDRNPPFLNKEVEIPFTTSQANCRESFECPKQVN